MGELATVQSISDRSYSVQMQVAGFGWEIKITDSNSESAPQIEQVMLSVSP